MQVLNSFHSARTAVDASVQQRRPAQQPQKQADESTGTAARAMRLAVDPREWAGEGSTTDVHGLASSKTSMEYRRSERTALYIQTQEGDVVRLDFRTRDSLELDASQTRDARGEATELHVETRSSTKLSIRVRGDLNAEELAAIRDTLEQASKLAEDFFAGDVHAAFESAAALDVDGEQLAKVKLRMKVKERLTYSSQRVQSMPLGYPGSAPDTRASLAKPVDDGPAAVPAPEEAQPLGAPARATTAVAEAPVGVPSVKQGAALPDAPASADAPESAPARTAPTQRFEALRAVGGFLTRLMDTFGEHQPTGGDLQMSLKLRLFESTLVTMSRVQEADEKSTLSPLVHDTIDALATPETEPLDQVA